jgi:hypothetical protein
MQFSSGIPTRERQRRRRTVAAFTKNPSYVIRGTKIDIHVVPSSENRQSVQPPAGIRFAGQLARLEAPSSEQGGGTAILW